MLFAAADQSPAEALLQAFGEAVINVWIVPVAIAALMAAAIAIGIAKRIWRRNRFARSGIADIDNFGGETFEQYLQVLFTKLGYRVERTKFRGDYGGDLVLRKDGVRTVVQAKRWSKSVGVKAVQEAVAAKGYYDCTEAMVVTNSTFTRQAQHLARKNDVALWDRDTLSSKLSAFHVKDAVQSGPPAEDAASAEPPAPREPTGDLPSVETCQQCAKVLTPPMPENSLSGIALVICDIFASDSGRIAGPPSPPLDTSPSTFISKSSVSGSISGSDGKVFEDTIASAPPLNAARASSAISVVDGVSFAHTGIFATSLTTSVTIDTCS